MIQKLTLVIFLSFLAMGHLAAQKGNLVLQFSGKNAVTNQSVSLTSVYVENVSKNCDTTLYGSAPNLVLSWPSGINDRLTENTGEFILEENYPNPYRGSTKFRIQANERHNFRIALFSIDGAEVAEANEELVQGTHEFEVITGRPDLFLLSVSNGKTIQSIKLINRKSDRDNNHLIKYLGAYETGNLKSANEVNVFEFYPGDQLTMTASANGYDDVTINDSPTGDKNYTFNLPPQEVVIGSENFNDGWGSWTTYNVNGDQVWGRDNNYGIDGTPCARMNGYEGQSNENQDWLISPPFNFNNYVSKKLSFYTAKGYSGDELQLRISTNYSGSGYPLWANWEVLPYAASPGSWEWTHSGEIDLSGYYGLNVYIAFRYTSTSTESATWQVDDILLTGLDQSFDPEPSNYPTNFVASASGTTITLSWTDATGEQLPNKYLIYGSTSSALPVPEDGIPVEDDPDLSDGSGALNISYGVEQASFEFLISSTTYYFAIYPYSNSNDKTDYKTDGSAPSTQATTESVGGEPCPGTPTVSYYGKTYNTVQIGTQCWLKENLNVGTMINGVDTMFNNGIIEKYCYDNNQSNCNTYGGLYNWDEMMQYTNTQGVKGICPTGWHIPTNAEWTILSDLLGGTEVAGGKMKQTGTIQQGNGTWHEPNAGATNESGFTALPAGFGIVQGVFYVLGYGGYFWSSTQDAIYPGSAWERHLSSDAAKLHVYSSDKPAKLSVRCLKN